jgi:hypothetical protein
VVGDLPSCRSFFARSTVFFSGIGSAPELNDAPEYAKDCPES